LDSTRNASQATDARPRTDVFVQVDNIKA
jgi:hypothetical protein